jgi:hypothetical protein
MEKSIKYMISFQENPGLIRVSIHGPIDDAAAHSIVTEAIDLAERENRSWFLYDLRDAKIQMTPTEMFYLPRDFEVSKSHRVAAIIPEDDPTGDWQFLETVERNAGIHMKLFTDEKKAIEWLTGGETTAG